jgi:hypothetical protein
MPVTGSRNATAQHGSAANAIVVLGHAALTNDHAPFTSRMRGVAANFKKPMLYLHADLDEWQMNRPWPEQNLLNVEVEDGGTESPVRVIVDTTTTDVFSFERNPL